MLIAQYLFKDNANDELASFNGVANGVTYEASPITMNLGGKVSVFNGSAYITLPNITSLSGTNIRSIEFWVYTNVGTTTRQAVFCSGAATSNLAFEVEMPAYNASVGVTNSYGIHTWASTINTSATVAMSNWTHVVATFGGGPLNTGGRIFLNGVNQGLAYASTTVPNTTNSNFCIGKSLLETKPFTGKLANFRLYNHVMSEDMALSHFQVESVVQATTNYLINGRGRNRLSISGISI